jgi:two-component system, NarL family, nitrate/nitrite response regulator NarL
MDAELFTVPAHTAPQMRILLVDKQAVVRAGLRLLINSQPSLQVAYEAARLAEATPYLTQRPDLILFNLHAGVPEDTDELHELLALAHQAPVLVLTGKRELELHYRAFGEIIAAGLKGIVFREDTPELLLNALETIRADGVWLSHSTLARVLGKMLNSNRTLHSDPEILKVAALTRREREIVALICQGLKNKQIAVQLALSEATVRHYLTSIFGKLGVADRLELALYAHRYGLQHRVAEPAPDARLNNPLPRARSIGATAEPEAYTLGPSA